MNENTAIRLILVRHGNTFEKGQTPTQVGARTDLPLTEQGRRQAELFASYLSAEKLQPQAIYTGALKRQIETAQIVAQHLQIKKAHLHESALTEIDYGPWEGLTSEAIAQKWPQEYQAWTTQALWPSFFGSTQEAHRLAIKNWLDQLRHAHAPGEIVLGVTSNGIIRFFYSFQEALWQDFILNHRVEDLKVKTGHFCELLLFKDSVQIKSWNLDPKALLLTNR